MNTSPAPTAEPPADPVRGRRFTRATAATLPILIAGIVAVGAASAAYLGGLFNAVEQTTINARFQLRHEPPPQGIVLVTIDDLSFNELGHRIWPLRRSLHAAAINRIAAAHPREIVYDIQFTEPTQTREDVALFKAIGRAGGAVLATTEIDDHGHTNVLGGDSNLAQIHAQAAASNLGDTSAGVITRFPYSIAGLKTMAVAAAERVTGRALDPSYFPRRGALIDYRGATGTFPAVPFSRVLEGRFDPASFRDKIVVVGVSAPTLQDVHPTPTSGAGLMSGPEVQANAIWTALHGVPLRSVPTAVNLLLIALLGMLAPLARLRLRMLTVALAAPAAGLAYAFAAHLMFDAGAVVAVIAPLVSLGVGGAGALVTSHLLESHERARVSRDNELLEDRVRERTEELRDTQLEIVRRLGQAAESRDGETGLHIERMSRLCQRMGRAVGMSVEEAELLRHASVMHDVGKIGIPDRVLLKSGKFTAEEWETMKSHTTIGAVILAGSRSPLVRMAETIAFTHHERWDGTGYPSGLRGEEIPLVGRIAAICDVFDALLSKRPYKEAWSLPEAVAEITREGGAHFDPKLVETFLELVPRLEDDAAGGLISAPSALADAAAGALGNAAGAFGRAAVDGGRGAADRSRATEAWPGLRPAGAENPA